MAPRHHLAPGGARFTTTRWSLVLAVGQAPAAAARDALAALCTDYWYPLYAYLRRRGHSAADAEDLVQGFLAHLIERRQLHAADPQRGRFRAFLLAALDHYRANQRRAARTRKRGAGQPLLSLDLADGERRYRLEPADPRTPEKLFERRWALAVLDSALARLRAQWHQRGKLPQFEQLTPYLGRGAGPLPYADLAQRLGVSVAAVKVAVHRLRRRCRELIRDEIAHTVAHPDDIDDELRALFASFDPA
jgi:RNA polymerase sigma-70 factor (ECF subfamily)